MMSCIFVLVIIWLEKMVSNIIVYLKVTINYVQKVLFWHYSVFSNVYIQMFSNRNNVNHGVFSANHHKRTDYDDTLLIQHKIY